MPLIHSYDSLLALARKINKSERQHDLVIASYVLGEIASLKDRFTIVRQLWDLTRDVLVLVEPGTPHGANIISQVRSHILWMEKRKCRKLEAASKVASKDLITEKIGAHVVAPCPHDGACPLDNTEKYCHFVQRLERTTSQRAYKRSKGVPLRGFEDEKFCYVAFRRGPRPREPWPLDGIKFETLKEQHAKRNPEDLVDYEDPFGSELEELPGEEDIVKYDSDITGKSVVTEDEDEEEDDEEEEGEEEGEETARADVGSGWGRIVYSPVRRGRLVEMNICRSTNREGSEGCFERVVVTKSKNPTLHHQARKSLWGDLWPF